MKNKLLYTFEEDLEKRMKNPDFKKVWKESEPEFILAKQLIEKRSQRKLSQRALAKKLHTTQAVISRLETMQANPSLELIKRIAKTLNTQITLNFK